MITAIEKGSFGRTLHSRFISKEVTVPKSNFDYTFYSDKSEVSPKCPSNKACEGGFSTKGRCQEIF